MPKEVFFGAFCEGSLRYDVIQRRSSKVLRGKGCKGAIYTVSTNEVSKEVFSVGSGFYVAGRCDVVHGKDFAVRATYIVPLVLLILVKLVCLDFFMRGET